MSRLLSCLVLGLALAVAPGSASAQMVPPAARARPDTTNLCLLCHAAQREAAEVGVHSEYGVRCVNCHGGDPTAGDQALAHRGRFLGVPTKTQTAQLCGSCHSDPDRMREYALPTGQLAEYRTSKHGQLLFGRQNTDAPTCTDCHGTHIIYRPDDARSQVYPTNIPGTCAHCHSNDRIMAKYDLRTGQFEDFRQSAHGDALYRQQNFAAPTCVGCHGAHSALPPTVKEIGNVCSRCHALVGQAFAASPHGGGGGGGPHPGLPGLPQQPRHRGHDRRPDHRGLRQMPRRRHPAAPGGVDLQQRLTRLDADMRSAQQAIDELQLAGRPGGRLPVPLPGRPDVLPADRPGAAPPRPGSAGRPGAARALHFGGARRGGGVEPGRSLGAQAAPPPGLVPRAFRDGVGLADAADSQGNRRRAGDRSRCPPRRRRRLSRIVRIGIPVVILVVILGAVGTVGFVQVSSQPGFCKSCHIMQPYYDSWRTSSHRDIACIQCHIAPGIRAEAMTKIQAANMVVKYFTGAYGTRPWAEIDDAACLRSGCHSERLIEGVGGVQGRPVRPHPAPGRTPPGDPAPLHQLPLADRAGRTTSPSPRAPVSFAISRTARTASRWRAASAAIPVPRRVTSPEGYDRPRPVRQGPDRLPLLPQPGDPRHRRRRSAPLRELPQRARPAGQVQRPHPAPPGRTWPTIMSPASSATRRWSTGSCR